MHKTFDFKIRILMNLTDLIQGSSLEGTILAAPSCSRNFAPRELVRVIWCLREDPFPGNAV